MTSPLPRRLPIIPDHKSGDLKKTLDEIYLKVNTKGFIINDPVQFPHRYKKKEDVEIAAFLAATIAWGRRDIIIRNCDRMFGMMKDGPHAFVMSGDFKKLGTKCVHRTFNENDLKYYCLGLQYCYSEYGDLESLFASALRGDTAAKTVWDGMILFRETIARGNKGLYSIHIADAASNSACKRLNLALRWLVRKGPVDLGIWKSITPASLYIPLDVHVGRIARRLDLLDPARKSNDKKAVLMLTGKLRGFCPEDPVKYDFALFGIGAGEV